MRYLDSREQYILDFETVIDAVRSANPNISDLYDPFCKGLAIVNQFRGRINTHASDMHPDLVSFYDHIKKNGLDDLTVNISKDLFQSAYHSSELFKDWAGFWIRYAGSKINCMDENEWFPGYFDGGVWHNFAEDTLKSIKREYLDILRTNVSCNRYSDVEYIPGSIIVCNIPYRAYYYPEVECHKRFYSWAKKMAENHVVIVSEYFMPDKDFIRLIECTEFEPDHYGHPGMPCTVSNQEYIWMVRGGYLQEEVREILRIRGNLYDPEGYFDRFAINKSS